MVYQQGDVPGMCITLLNLFNCLSCCPNLTGRACKSRAGYRVEQVDLPHLRAIAEPLRLSKESGMGCSKMCRLLVQLGARIARHALHMLCTCFAHANCASAKLRSFAASHSIWFQVSVFYKARRKRRPTSNFLRERGKEEARTPLDSAGLPLDSAEFRDPLWISIGKLVTKLSIRTSRPARQAELREEMAEEQLRTCHAMHMQCICNAYAMHHDGDASQFVDMILLELFDDILISLLGTVVRLCGRHESVQVFCNDFAQIGRASGERTFSMRSLAEVQVCVSSFCLAADHFRLECGMFVGEFDRPNLLKTSLKPLRNFRNFGSHVPHETPSLPDLPRGEDRSSEIGR